MEAFEINDLIDRQVAQKRPYLEFLRHSSMSLGVYTLPAGSKDPQQPHTEDEVYYVVKGQASITVGSEERVVGPGSIIFVAAGVVHYFHTIREDLTLLVFFAPAEGSLGE